MVAISDNAGSEYSSYVSSSMVIPVSDRTMPLTGVIKNASGTGVANLLVRLLPEFDPTSGTMGRYLETVTDANGHYSFNAKQGRYRLELVTSYRDGSGNLVTIPDNLMGGFVNGKGGVINGWDAASVLQFSDTTQLDATLDTAFTFSGAVKTSDDKPVAGAHVIIHTLDWEVVSKAKSLADGSFTALVRPGMEYRVLVFPAWCEAGNNDVTQGCGTGQVSFLGGQWVQSGTTGDTLNGTVTPGDDAIATKLKADKSLVLAVKVDLGQKVMGRVVDGTGVGMAYAWVDSPVGGVPTDANGYFTLTIPSSGLPSGFKLSVHPGGHEDPTSHAWVPGTAFIGGDVTGNTTSGFSLIGDPTAATILTAWPALALGDAGKNGLKIVVGGGITIQGSVKDGTNGLANIWVNAHAVGGGEGQEGASKSDGTFSILIPAPASGSTVWYEIAPWSDRYLMPDPLLVSVTASGVSGVYAIDKAKSVDSTGLYKPVAGSRIGMATTVDFTISTGKTISGRVTDASNNGLPWTWIDFHTQDGGKYFGAFSDENGNYSLTVAPSQSYVGVIWGGKGQYRTTFYKNAAKESDATPIVVGTSDLAGIDFQLDSGSKISGTVA
ncbi:MAG: carboxypeptidase-like regulatory domain-containing protein, partial [Magnetococcus sp. YQC-9]